MKIAYVLEDAGLSGGAKVVLEHCNRLAKRGHDVTLFTVTSNDPKRWFPLKVKRIVAGSYNALRSLLEAYDGYKTATWWKTALPVAESGGRGFYLVQDIETSYLENEREHKQVLATYEYPLTKICEGIWVQQNLDMAKYVGIGIDHDIFKPMDTQRKEKSIIYNYRMHFLKDPDLFIQMLPYLPKEYSVSTFGMDKPKDRRCNHNGFVTEKDVALLYNQSAVCVVSSRHEGFCLPIIEAMACGCPVVTTNADANMEFCVDGFNCLVVDRNPEKLAKAVQSVCCDNELRSRIIAEGIKTASRYKWDSVIDKLETIYDTSFTKGA